MVFGCLHESPESPSSMPTCQLRLALGIVGMRTALCEPRSKFLNSRSMVEACIPGPAEHETKKLSALTFSHGIQTWQSLRPKD